MATGIVFIIFFAGLFLSLPIGTALLAASASALTMA